MAAVIDLRTGSAVSPPDEHPRRPALTVIEGGRSPAALRRRRVYLRRRVAVAAVLIVVAGALVQAAASLVVSLTAIDTEVPTVVHRVAPGDTLWAVAGAADPTADRRDLIDQIVALNADGFSPDEPLQLGQELLVPAPGV
jgi:Tfp pilus assembly protein FimV